MKKEGIFTIIAFALGLLFYSKVLDKPERQFIIKRLKQKKGSGNVMDVTMNEVPLEMISGTMTRREVIKKWKELKEQLKTTKN